MTIFIPLSFLIGIGASAIGVTAWMMLVPILFVLFGFDLYLTIFISLLVDCGNALIMLIIAGQNGKLSLKTGLGLSPDSHFACLCRDRRWYPPLSPTTRICSRPRPFS